MTFTVTMYLTIDAESEEQARTILDGIEVRSRDDESIFWSSLQTELEAEDHE
ncbi:MAG: hypothetical protein JWQ19_3889 [Subtercola sp.]|nr:hypothetical protein [Subtercola sp.]